MRVRALLSGAISCWKCSVKEVAALSIWLSRRSRCKRRVALKVIKLGNGHQTGVARFEAERQALALMDHPNIAKVLDAGATEPGRPYFVMELVRGIKITDYCDQNQLSTTRNGWNCSSRFASADPARAPERHHPSRHQALEHPGGACRTASRCQK